MKPAMLSTQSVPALPGKTIDHRCCFVDSSAPDHDEMIGRLLHAGAQRGQFTFYVSDETPRAAFDLLHTPPGRSDICVLPPSTLMVRDNLLDHEHTIETIRRETRKALRRGYSGTRFILDMSWVLNRSGVGGLLYDYEARINEHIADMASTVVCLYDRRKFSPSLLVYAMTTHPMVMVGTDVYPNKYFIAPPEVLVTKEKSSKILYSWIKECALAHAGSREQFCGQFGC